MKKIFFLSILFAVLLPCAAQTQVMLMYDNQEDVITRATFINAQDGLVVNSTGLQITHDGGQTFSPVLTSVYFNNPKAIVMKDESTFYLSVHDGVSPTSYLLHTQNSGSTWDTLYQQTGSFNYNCIETVGEQLFYYGNSPTYLHSVDNGLSFSEKTFNENERVLNIEFANQNEGAAIIQEHDVATSAFTPPIFRLYLTNDGGQNWTLNSTIIDESYSSAVVLDYQDGHLLWGTEYGKLFYSSNNGSTWTEHTFMNGDYQSNILNVKWINEAYAYAQIDQQIVRINLTTFERTPFETEPIQMYWQSSVFINANCWFFYNNEVSCGMWHGRIWRYHKHATTAIGEATANEATISVHPNPATQSITLTGTQLNDFHSATLYDTAGKIVSTFTLSPSKADYCETAVLSLPNGIMAGVYVLVLSNGTKQHTQKIVVQ